MTAVRFEVDVPSLGLTLTNWDEPGGRDFPVHMEVDRICEIPPLEAVYAPANQKMPLFIKGTKVAEDGSRKRTASFSPPTRRRTWGRKPPR